MWFLKYEKPYFYHRQRPLNIHLFSLSFLPLFSFRKTLFWPLTLTGLRHRCQWLWEGGGRPSLDTSTLCWDVSGLAKLLWVGLYWPHVIYGSWRRWILTDTPLSGRKWCFIPPSSKCFLRCWWSCAYIWETVFTLENLHFLYILIRSNKYSTWPGMMMMSALLM